ncbi:MAG: alpha-hydroxy-acid oxidizing enzyme, partial [Candidatus Fonsibacter sp.]
MTKIKTKRVFPSFKAIFGLIRFRKPIFKLKRRRLARALTIYDLRTIAKRRTPKAPFDYTDGAADSES